MELRFAILIGGFVSGNPWKPMPRAWQEAAGTLMSVAVLLFGARLSFNIGPQLKTLFNAGAALLLQEVGGRCLIFAPTCRLCRLVVFRISPVHNKPGFQ